MSLLLSWHFDGSPSAFGPWFPASVTRQHWPQPFIALPQNTSPASSVMGQKFTQAEIEDSLPPPAQGVEATRGTQMVTSTRKAHAHSNSLIKAEAGGKLLSRNSGMEFPQLRAEGVVLAPNERGVREDGNGEVGQIF